MRRLRLWLVVVLAALLGSLAAAPGGAATLSLDISPDPTVDKPVTVTASGEVARARLHVFVNWNRQPCAPSWDQNPGYEMRADGEGWFSTLDVEGPFSHRYSFTPTWQLFHPVCAYLEHAGSTVATAFREVTPRAIRAAVAVAVEPVTAGEKTVVTVSGSTEVPRQLFVREQSGGGCGPKESVYWGHYLSPLDGTKIEGAFSQRYTVTANGGEHVICAWIGQQTYVDADATAVGTASLVSPSPPKSPEDPGAVRPANLLLPAAGITGAMLSPTFRWTSADVDRDVMVLEYRKGERENFAPYVAVWMHGASWVSEDDFDSLGSLLDALGDRDEKADGWASFTSNGGQAEVKFRKPIEPGRYRWLVYTGLVGNGGRIVPSEQREFTVHGPALRNLRVSTRARKGSSTKSPGETALRISVTRFANVRIELRRGGKRSVRNLAAGNATKLTVPVEWSCKKSGGRYRYRVTARDSHGKQLTRSGTFRPVSTARCRTMRNQEQRAKTARQREVDRRVAERRRAEAAAQQGRINRFKSNCRKLGGTPELIHSSDGSYWVCVAPWGGTWNVPY